MSEVFADTFYFVALLSKEDAAHSRARSIAIPMGTTLVTSTWVLVELANSLRKPETRTGFLTTLRALETNPTAVIIGPEVRWYRAGIELYADRPDKDWSLTDCISFVIMKDRRITDALTGDHHFEQAGFRALLR